MVRWANLAYLIYNISKLPFFFDSKTRWEKLFFFGYYDFKNIIYKGMGVRTGAGSYEQVQPSKSTRVLCDLIRRGD